jgi:hypothetical protein
MRPPASQLGLVGLLAPCGQSPSPDVSQKQQNENLVHSSASLHCNRLCKGSKLHRAMHRLYDRHGSCRVLSMLRLTTANEKIVSSFHCLPLAVARCCPASSCCMASEPRSCWFPDVTTFQLDRNPPTSSTSSQLNFLLEDDCIVFEMWAAPLLLLLVPPLPLLPCPVDNVPCRD